MREFLITLTPQMRRYAHALMGGWPCAPSRDGERPRPDQDADDLVQEALLGFWRASGEGAPFALFPRASLRLAVYRRITALARERLPVRRLEEAAARADGATQAERASPARHYAWAPEASALPRLSLEQRALLALAALERLTYAEIAETLDMDEGQILPRLAVARARMSSELSGAARAHLEPALCGDGPAPAGGPITQADLHMFVDDALDLERRDEVSRWLEDQPEATRRAAEWRRQAERLRAAFEPLSRMPAPLSLNFSMPDPAFWAERRAVRQRGFFARLGAACAHWLFPQPGRALRPL
jgi:RNA polymerase sigma factor (sigma-70 family)